MAIELGTAYISILPSTKGLAGALAREFTGIAPAVGDKAGKETGTTMATSMRDAFKSAGKRILTGTAVVGTMTLVGRTIRDAFQKGAQLDESRRVLEGLYGSVEEAGKVIAGLKRVSRRSPIDTTSYLKAAETLAYTGVEGERAVKILERVGKATVVAGSGEDGMHRAADAMLRMVNDGRVYTRTLNQLSAAGVPVFDALAAKFDTNIAKIREMVTAGEIGLEDVFAVIEDGQGPLFQQFEDAYAQTVQSFPNQWNMATQAISDSWAEHLEPLIVKMAPMVGAAGLLIADGIAAIPDAIKSIREVLEPVEDIIAAFGKAGGIVASVVVGVKFLIGTFRTLVSVVRFLFTANPWGLVITAIIAGVMLLWEHVEGFRDFVLGIWDWIKTTAVEAWEHITGPWGQELWASVVDWAKDAWETISEFAVEAWESYIKPTFEAIGNAAVWLWENAIQPAWEGIVTAFEWAWGMIGPVIAGIIDFFTSDSEEASNTFSKVFGVIKSTIQMILAPLRVLWDVAVGAFAIIVSYIRNFMAPAFKWWWNTIIKPVFQWVSQTIGRFWTFVIQPIFQKVDGIIRNVLAPVFQWLWENIIQPVWNAIATLTEKVWEGGLVRMFEFIGEVIADWLAPIIEYFGAVFIGTWDAIKAGVEAVWKWLNKNIFAPIGKLFTSTLPGWVDSGSKAVRSTWEAIQEPFRRVWNWLDRNVFTPIRNFITDTLPRGFRTGKDAISTAWDAIKTPIEKTWNWLKDNVFSPLEKLIKETIPKAFETGKDAVGRAWDKIKQVAKSPVNFVIGTVYNDGIRALWNKVAGALKLDGLKMPYVPKLASGGHVGAGRVRGRGGTREDRVPALLSNREHVWSAREVAAAGGHRGVMQLRAMARAGMIPAFKDGGFWSRVGGVLSNAWEGVKGFAKSAWNLATNPIEWLEDQFKGLLKGMPSEGFGQLMMGLPGTVLDWIRETIFRSVDDDKLLDLAGPGVWKRPSFGPVTSEFGYRTHPVTGQRRLHAGIDIAGGGPTFAAGDGRVSKIGWNKTAGWFINIDHGGGWQTRYLHNPGLFAIPVQRGQFVKAGQHIGAQGATGRVTGTHLHFEVRKNGELLNPRSLKLFDNGGWLPPGETLAVNKTGKPEAILTNRQWDAIMSHGLGGESYQVNMTVEASDFKDLKRIEDFLEMIRRERERGRRTARSGVVTA